LQDRLAGKAKWYKAKAIECAALAKSARPNFVRKIYRKAAVRYDSRKGCSGAGWRRRSRLLLKNAKRLTCSRARATDAHSRS
jgi:hypothetical protein